MRDPEIHSRRDALLGDEMRAVFPPGEHALGRLLGALDDAHLRDGMMQQGAHDARVRSLRAETSRMKSRMSGRLRSKYVAGGRAVSASASVSCKNAASASRRRSVCRCARTSRNR